MQFRSGCSFSCLCLVLFSLSGVDSSQAWQTTEDDASNFAIYDHHIHVMSPELIGHWKTMGVPFSREDSAYCEPLTILESQNLDGACLVSMAHLYTTEDLASIADIGENEQAWVQKENDFVGQCASKSPTNLVAFFSVNPLRDYAIQELNRCRNQEHLTGLKLHFPACGVDLSNEEHLEKIGDVFDWAIENNVPMLVHLFGADEENPRALADLFWKQLIQPRDSIEIILAHLGAAGGYNDTSQAILSGYHALKTANPKFENARIHFDLSGAILSEETDGIPATSVARCNDLSDMIRQVGTQRFLFASDYPVFSVESTLRTLQTKLTLSDAEWVGLMSNKLRWFDLK